MEENKRTELDKINEKKEIMTPKDYRSIFWRSFTIQGSWSLGASQSLCKPPN